MTSFHARVIRGAGRGKSLGTPTLNLDLRDVPSDIREGIYASWIWIDGERTAGALHYGPRPFTREPASCEVHVLDRAIASPPSSLTVATVRWIRPICDFPSEALLKAQIADDIAQARAILNTCSTD